MRRLAVLMVLWACGGDSSVENIDLTPGGGEFSTADGKLTFDTPSGAVGRVVRLAVQRIDSPAAGSIGPVYDVGPAGHTFALPVTVVIRVDDRDRMGRVFATLRAAALDSGGHWMTLARPQLSEGQGTVSGDTTTTGTFSVVAVPPPQPDAGVPDSRPVDARN
jgi:hypothetical protein